MGTEEIIIQDWQPLPYRCKHDCERDGQKDRIAELEGALRKVMTGGNHVALLIGADHPPYTATYDEALAHYGAGDAYEAWNCWKTIMEARDVLEG